MKIKLNNNQNLTQPILTSNFKHKCESIYISNCGNTMNAKTFLDAVIAYQKQQIEQGRMEQMVLGAFAVDLPYDSTRGRKQYSGTFDELMSYQNFRGASLLNGDSGKPIFNGTWILTDYVDQSDLDAIAAKFNMDHLTLEHPHFLDWDSYAVQSVDSTRKNYNPTVSIVLNAHGVGDLVERSARRAGRYVFTKADAEELDGIGNWFSGLTSAEDTDKIVTNYSGTAPSYGFTSFNELSSFTGLTRIDSSAFENDTSLTTIVLPDSIVGIGQNSFHNCASMDMPSFPQSVESVAASAFQGCGSLTLTGLSDSLLEIDTQSFEGCTSLALEKLPENLTYILTNAFSGCESLAISEIPSSVGFIGENAFSGCDGIGSLHFLNGKSMTAVCSGCFDGTDFPIYVGTSESSYLDKRIELDCRHDENWAPYADRIGTWYTKTYRDSVDSDLYDVVEWVQSDCKHSLASGAKFVDGSSFVTDVGFFSMDENDVYTRAVHGSQSVGLDGSLTEGLVADIGGTVYQFAAGNDFCNSEVHTYGLDFRTTTFSYDGETAYTKDDESSADNSDITFFGNGSKFFTGASWMNRVFVDGELRNDFVPVRQKSTGKLGFYDAVNDSFVGHEDYQSDEFRLGFGDSESNRFVTEDGDVILL